jgi:hypothetical protein
MSSKVIKIHSQNGTGVDLKEGPQTGITCGLPVVRQCLDTLRVSLWLSWENLAFMDHLNEQKEIVQSTEADSIAVMSGSKLGWNLHRTGTSKFNFRLSSGDIHLLLNKRKSDGVIPNCRFEIGSISCWSPGYQKIYENVIAFLRLQGAKIVKERVSEVHIAADFIGLDIRTLDLETQDKWIHKSTTYDLYYQHRKFTGLSIGKGDLMMRIYDKVLELKTQRAVNKQEVFSKIWGLKNYSDMPVTRVEFQLRRPKIKEFTNIKHKKPIDTVQQLIEALPSLWAYMTSDWVRHTTNPVNRNHNQSKAKISIFWYLVRDVVWNGLLEYIKENPNKHKNIASLRDQARGILMSVCASFNVPDSDIEKIVKLSQEVIEEDLKYFFENRSQEFIKRMKVRKNEALSSISISALG